MATKFPEQQALCLRIDSMQRDEVGLYLARGLNSDEQKREEGVLRRETNTWISPNVFRPSYTTELRGRRCDAMQCSEQDQLLRDPDGSHAHATANAHAAHADLLVGPL